MLGFAQLALPKLPDLQPMHQTVMLGFVLQPPAELQRFVRQRRTVPLDLVQLGLPVRPAVKAELSLYLPADLPAGLPTMLACQSQYPAQPSAAPE